MNVCARNSRVTVVNVVLGAALVGAALALMPGMALAGGGTLDVSALVKPLSPTYQPDIVADAEVLSIADQVFTDPGEVPRFEMEVEGERYHLPLEHTHYEAKITGHVAHVEVRQRYRNPLETPIETVYVFPLPENSAVDDLEIVIGDRVVKADIQRRDQARKTYETAKKAGHTAALLEQERPNVFTQSVANIAPESEIEVAIRYVQDMGYDAGTYELAIPMVVGPRYTPGDPTGGEQSGDGWQPDTTEVGDASRVTPPILGNGTRSGHDISVSVTVDAGVPVHDLRVPTHDVVVTPSSSEGAETTHVELANRKSLPNRDFVMRYGVAGDAPQAVVKTHHDGESGYLTMIVQPPELDVDALVGHRDLVFVVDVSGSMTGAPLGMAIDAIQVALDKMRPTDRFNVITFAGRSAKLWPEPRPANKTNLGEARGFVKGLRAGGGTEMLNAVEAALSIDDTSRNRHVFFLTDGYVSNEGAIAKAAESYVLAFMGGGGAKARVFALGTGSSVNRSLLDGLAQAGDGVAMTSTLREDPQRAVDRFFGLVDHPVIEDVAIDWGGADVVDVQPAVMPTLFASHPLTVHARYDEGADDVEIRVRGRASNGRDVEIPVALDLPAEAHGDAVHGTLWARSKVRGLERRLWGGYDAEAAEAIAELGLSHRLVTRYTSLVAVDRSRVVEGESEKIVQPVDTPEGVDAEAAAGTAGTSYGTGRGGAVPRGRGFGNKSAGSAGEAGASSADLAAESDSSSTALKGHGKGSTRYSSRGGYGKSGSYATGTGTVGSSPKSKRDASSRPTLRASKAKVMGSLSRNKISRVFRGRQRLFRRCYEKALKRSDPTLSGRVVLQVVIGADGKVAAVKVKKSTLDDSEMEACLAKVARVLRFPATDGQVVVAFPLSFETEDTAKEDD